MAKKRAKRAPEPEVEEVIESDDEVSMDLPAEGPPNDGPRYSVSIELPDSEPGGRHYSRFFETEKIDAAKSQCEERGRRDAKMAIVWDREEQQIIHRFTPEGQDDQQYSRRQRDSSPSVKPTQRKRATRSGGKPSELPPPKHMPKPRSEADREASATTRPPPKHMPKPRSEADREASATTRPELPPPKHKPKPRSGSL